MAYNSAFKGSEIDAAVNAVKKKETIWDKKQDALTGTAGQMVGFDSDGNPVAQAVPATGLTEAEADGKYLKLTGGDLSDDFHVRLDSGGDEDGSYLFLLKDTAFFGVGSSTGTNFSVYGRKASIESTDSITIDATKGINLISRSGEITIQNPVSIKPGTADTHAATVAQAVPKVTLVTLTASGWDSSAKTQTVTVSGIDADESKQWIMPTPAAGHKTAYDNAGIQCTAQAANAVTFTASTVPTADIKVWVKVETVNDVTPA